MVAARHANPLALLGECPTLGVGVGSRALLTAEEALRVTLLSSQDPEG